MKRSLILLLSALSLASCTWAEEAKAPQDVSAYLEQLQLKLDHTAQRANQPGADGSNVVGLRGSKQEPLSKQLYWKGKAGDTPVTPDEIKTFRAAIDQAKAGKKDAAVTSLKSFVEKYPKSGLRPDAETTMKMLADAAPAKPQ